MELLKAPTKKKHIYISRQETPNSVGGKRILHYNMDDDGHEEHDDGEEEEDDHEDEDEDEDEDDDDDYDDDDDDDEDEDEDERVRMRGWGWEGDEVDVEEEEEEEDDDVEWEEVEEEGSQDQEAHFMRACAVKMHMDTWQERFCGNLQEKCRTPIPGQAFCASLRRRNAHGHFTRAIL